jgi:hypothetical protein
VDSSGSEAVCYVAVDIKADTSQTIMVTVNEYTSPPSTITDLTATLAGNLIHLSWSAVTEDTADIPIVVDHYVIYRNADPLFTPNASDSVASTTATSHDDPTPALKNPAENHYYVVKAVDDQGRKSSDSNTVGEFDAGLLNAPPVVK